MFCYYATICTTILSSGFVNKLCISTFCTTFNVRFCAFYFKNFCNCGKANPRVPLENGARGQSDTTYCCSRRAACAAARRAIGTRNGEQDT